MKTRREPEISARFIRALKTEWRKLALPTEEKTILIAVSGGADSVSLALALGKLVRRKKLGHRFVVAHFNHNLRGAESDADAHFVRELARNLEFGFVTEIENPKSKIRNQKGNLEQNARRARYDFLARAAADCRAFGVLTAHTLNDQAETFLFNLLRGSGAGGLGAMKAVRKLNENDETLLIRPLLSWAGREMTEQFCRAEAVDFRRDRMNDDLNFSRVRIRKTLVPFLREFNPRVVETLAQTANLLREEAQAFEQITADLLPLNENALSLKELKNFSEPVRRRLVRQWLGERRGSLRRLTMKHLEAIERLISGTKSGREVELPAGGKIIKTGGRLVFKNSKVEKSPPAD